MPTILNMTLNKDKTLTVDPYNAESVTDDTIIIKAKLGEGVENCGEAFYFALDFRPSVASSPISNGYFGVNYGTGILEQDSVVGYIVYEAPKFFFYMPTITYGLNQYNGKMTSNLYVNESPST